MTLILKHDKKHPPGDSRVVLKWFLTNFYLLLMGTIVESDAVPMGRFSCKLVTQCHYLPNGQVKGVRILLLNCSRHFVTLHGCICPHMRNQAYKTYEERTGCPFGIIADHYIPFERANDSGNNLLLDGVMAGTVDLKDIERATEEEKERCENDGMLVNLEIIDRRSMQRVSNQKASSRLLSCDIKRNADVHGCSSMRLWGDRNPDLRYWLVERSKDGMILNMHCLSNFSSLLTFADVFKQTKDRFTILTLFREEKRPGEDFQTVDENTVMVFCKLSEPSYEDFSFIGYQLLQKTTPCPDLLDSLAGTARLREGQFRAYLQVDSGMIDITGEQRSLEKCGIHSGSCVILNKCLQAKDFLFHTRQQAVGAIGDGERTFSEKTGHQTTRTSGSSSSDGHAVVRMHNIRNQASVSECHKNLEEAANSTDHSVPAWPQQSASPSGQRSLRLGAIQSAMLIIFSVKSALECLGRHQASADRIRKQSA